VRRAFAILFSVVLVLTQSQFLAGASAPAAQRACAGCACGKAACPRDCCLDRSAPVSQPLPVVPSRTAAQDHSFSLLPTALLVTVSVCPISEVATPFPSPARAKALPLYQRNCAWLI